MNSWDAFALAGPGGSGGPYAQLLPWVAGRLPWDSLSFDSAYQNSYKHQVVTSGNVYEQSIGTDGFQHGTLERYLELADQFDQATFDNTTVSSAIDNAIQQRIKSFAGQVLVNDEVRVSDGTPGGRLVPIYTVNPSPA